MQIVKFKAMRKDKNEWIEGSCLYLNGNYYIHRSNTGDLDDIDFGRGFIEVIPETLQFLLEE